MPGAYVRIEVLNADVVRQGLQSFASELPKIGRLQILRAVQAIAKRAGVYPAALPGQKYVRTYQLRQSRRIEKTPKGYTLSINPLDERGRSYGVYVLGVPAGGGQTAFHRNRWVPIAIIQREELEKLPPEVIKQLREAANRGAARTHVK